MICRSDCINTPNLAAFTWYIFYGCIEIWPRNDLYLYNTGITNDRLQRCRGVDRQLVVLDEKIIQVGL